MVALSPDPIRLAGFPPAAVHRPAAFVGQRDWLARQFARALRLLWWTVTLQLPKQFVLWRRAQHRRRAGGMGPIVPPTLFAAADPRDIRIQTAPRPLVSVIIPTYGQLRTTLCCLAAIAANPPEAAIEVIVIDDASADPDVARLAQVQGIRFVVQADNLGFLRTCNMAARLAQGEFLLFLNNDTQVQSGWLDAMLESFRRDPAVGAVGSKLIYPDGRLQEAGGVIWSDGTGWNIGRLDHPDRPEYNYPREVDYCSGASLMVPRVLFADLGGFDERYAPAYFEDADLAFRLRARGRKVVYQPRSCVVHMEGVSHGTDLAAGGKSFQAVNRHVFVESWAEVLATRHYPSGQHVLRAREHARCRPVVLILDHEVPTPERDAGSRTMLAIARALLQEGMLVKFASHIPCGDPARIGVLEQMGVAVIRDAERDPAARWIAENGDELDMVVLSRPQVAAHYLPIVRRHSAARIVFYGHDLHFSRLRQQAELRNSGAITREATAMERLERRVWRGSDLVLYPSVVEAERVAMLEPSVSAHAIAPYSFQDFPGPRTPVVGQDILFVGGFAHSPNQDAVLWLVHAILPLIHVCAGAARLRIVGADPPALVRALAGPCVTILANISEAELAAEYRRARVALAPLRFGAGVKMKAVEALAAGVPLVTTPVGAQGLPGLGDVASVCRDAEGIADSVCLLLADDTLWRARSTAGVAYTRERFSEAAMRASLMAAFGASAPAC
jgi:GT2 family glycosyltransferase/glycosyltransferase involved in cell wall biosynthesis